MIRLGLRLTLAGGREAALRLLVITVAVMLGVGLLLATLAGINAVNSQNGRYGWLATGDGSHSDPRAAASPAVDPLWWLLSADEFHGTLIGRVDVAATGPLSPMPPGITRLPGPGEFLASPALARLLRSTPAAELGARYPGAQIGTIGPAALPSPSSLIIVVGHRVTELQHRARARLVTSISTTSPSSCNGSCYEMGIDANGIDLVLSVVTAAVLFPVLIFIATATRLSAARREQRFAAMRLVGATPGQVSVISTVESGVAALAGVLGGFVLFFLSRPLLARVPFTGQRFFAGDLTLNSIDTVTVAVGVPVAAVIAARVALRRVSISPLGVTRRVTPRPPRMWRVIPLLAGLGELAWFVHAGRPQSTPGQIQAYLTGILLTMVGLIVAGPWLTLVGARMLARRTGRPATLIAGRRLADNPQAGFRAISGLVLALFITSVAVGILTTIDAYKGGSSTSAAERQTLIDEVATYAPAGPKGVAAVPDATVEQLRATPGVTGVTLVHANPDQNRHSQPGDLVACPDLARTPVLGHCAPGASVAVIGDDYAHGRGPAHRPAPAAAGRSIAQVRRLPVLAIAVATDGRAAVERARTVLQHAYPYAYWPTTIAEDQAANHRLTTAYQRLAEVVVLTSLPIAGCALAVSVVAGLNDRRRPFSLLRLAGTPLGVLRRVVSLESAVPLLVLAAVAIGTGFATAGLFVSSQLQETLQPPGVGYYVVVAAGLLASLAIIGSTLPLLNRLTGPDVTRND